MDFLIVSGQFGIEEVNVLETSSLQQTVQHSSGSFRKCEKNAVMARYKTQKFGLPVSQRTSPINRTRNWVVRAVLDLDSDDEDLLEELGLPTL